ncbi:e3 ubiquitin-protein ligase rnf8 [Trichonephila inaurata madagascariensis]|uniref:E3 ubiquitin-protein ligase CHFR n=1 Tax=Trichonephila inaurata madagascariensis TaxID=2747483 RepID=A0A8X6XNF3_9ARAC|nr:e3 ubiquitin-protein ligase rnf8 [Trichonephila inaurata madagascariensis]
MEVEAYLRKVTNGISCDMLPLTSDLVTVGRFACDFIVDDATASRNHCSLKRLGKNWVLIDLKSVNGTYIGNSCLKPNTPYTLRNGNVFSIGPPNTASTIFYYTCIEDKERKLLKRKYDEQNLDEATQDSQRTAVPSICPSLGGDDGVSDSSVSSTDSLKTRIRKVFAANRKIGKSSENNLRVRSAAYRDFQFKTMFKNTYNLLHQRNIPWAGFRVLDTLCNEPASSMALIPENAKKTVNEDKETAVRLACEVENSRLKALEEQLEMLKARTIKQRSEELEKLLEHFACIICAEIMHEPMILNCSHSMCKYCLLKWKMKQNRCPICREKIVHETKNLLIRDFIDKTIEGMEGEFQANRRKLVFDRQISIASFSNKKKKPSRSRNFRRRINGVNDAGEGPSNSREHFARLTSSYDCL